MDDGGGGSTPVSFSGTPRVSADGTTVTSNVNCPVAGTLTGTLTALGKTRATKKPVLGRSSVSVSRAGKVTLKTKLNAAGRKTLKKKGKIKAKLTIRFAPSGGGKASSKSKTVTLKAPRKKKP